MRNKIIPYNPKLKNYARALRKRGTLADFYCHELQLAIEIDGISHDDKFEYEQMREHKLRSLGVNLIRFDDEDVKTETEAVLQALKKRIKQIEKE